jgi:hypothetical protein
MGNSRSTASPTNAWAAWFKGKRCRLPAEVHRQQGQEAVGMARPSAVR